MRERKSGSKGFFSGDPNLDTGRYGRLEADAAVGRAAKLAGHKSVLQRLRGRLGRSDGEAEQTR